MKILKPVSKRELCFIAIIFSLFLLVGCSNNSTSEDSVNNDDEEDRKSLLQKCPDEWIDNQMPGMVEEEEYYILDGERYEIDEFDQDWIEKNCDLKKEVVY